MQLSARVVVALASVPVASSCVDKETRRAIESQPILQPPPNASELWRDGSPPRSNVPGWNAGGTFELVWAVPADPEEAADWYTTTHGAQYQFRRSEERGGIRLDGLSPDRAIRVLVRLSPNGPQNVSETARRKVRPAPEGTRTWVTLHVDRNPHPH